VPSFDDRLRRDLAGLARPADSSGALDRVADRKRRLPRTRRIQALTMSVVVVAATSGAGYGLYRAFGLDKPPVSQVPTLSEPAGRIAFLRFGENGAGGVMVVSPDGSDLARLTDQPYLYSSSVDLAPDGRQVAFNVGIAEGRGAIDVVRSDGSVRERLSIPEFFNPADPAWSPDGERLAWSASNTNPPGIHVGAEVGGLRQLTVPPAECTDVSPSWSPDGSRIAFVRTCMERSYMVMVVPAEGGDPEEVVGGREVDWSPDGRSMLVTIASSHGDRYHQIYRYELATEELVQLTTQSYNSAPSWSPDGAWIAFQSSRDGNDEIYVMRADGSDQRNITNDPAGDVAPSWGPEPTGPGRESSLSPGG
jgi:Tol biopolymer transport system component